MATKFGRKVALITGCSEPASLGAAFALDLYSRGWRVFVSARKIQTLTGLESAGCEAVQLDVVDQESIDEAVHTVSELTDGRLDLLINNAGVVAKGPFLDMDVDKIKALYDVNVFGVVRVTQAFSPLLVHTANTDAYGAKRGQGQTTVVNIGSLATALPTWCAAYASSKAAVLHMSDSMRLELAPLGIRVTAVQLAFTHTPMNRGEKPFPILKDKVTGLYPWTDKLEPVHQGFIADTLPKMPPPAAVAKSIIDSLESTGPKPYIWTGYLASMVKYFVRYLPASVIDTIAGKQDKLHLIPRPVDA